MSIIRVNSIASVEDLKNAMGQYREQSLAVVQDFASALSEKIEYMESLDSYFAERVQIAENEYLSCEIGRASDPPEFQRSCDVQKAAFEKSKADYSNYRIMIERVRQARLEYNAMADNHKRSLQFISTSTLPKFTSIINDMKTYQTNTLQT